MVMVITYILGLHTLHRSLPRYFEGSSGNSLAKASVTVSCNSYIINIIVRSLAVRYADPAAARIAERGGPVAVPPDARAQRLSAPRHSSGLCLCLASVPPSGGPRVWECGHILIHFHILCT